MVAPTRPSKAWYNSALWKEKREHQLRTYPLCKSCLKRDQITAATVADHIDPHRDDINLFFHGELQSLCSTCHSGYKQRLENTGVSVGHDSSGKPLDPNHHWNN